MNNKKRYIPVSKSKATNKRTGKLKKGYAYRGGKVVEVRPSTFCSSSGKLLKRSKSSTAAKNLSSCRTRRTKRRK